MVTWIHCHRPLTKQTRDVSPLDDEITVSFVETCVPINLPRVMWVIELLLTTCSITVTYITKLTQSVMNRMTRSHVCILFSGPSVAHWTGLLGLLVDKDDLINYQLLIIYGLLLRIFTYQLTVDKTIRDINQLLIEEGLLMIVDRIWKSTNRVTFRLYPRSSHVQRQSTFTDMTLTTVVLSHVIERKM
jgi:hypothetical protein